jgi:enhanced filamentous growth protein 1
VVSSQVGKILHHNLTFRRIPYERALEFANREKITEYLYPLFVHDIGALLYHPSNPSGPASRVGNAQNTLAAIDRRRNESRMLSGTQAQGLPAQAISGALVSPVAQATQAGGRPSVDRTHNFPTPPASASSVVGMSAPGPGYDSWNNNMAALPGSQSLSIDTSISNQRSMPNTPASTPPGKTTQGTTHYPTPSYETSRSVYPSHTSQGSYAGQQRFSQSLPGFKSTYLLLEEFSC